MRHIMYKAWLVKEQQIEYVYSIYFSNIEELRETPRRQQFEKQYVAINAYQPLLLGEEVILLQYIGLKDRYLRPIYKGDIVKYDDELWVVVYDSGSAMFFLHNPEKENIVFEGYRFTPMTAMNCIIQGNVFEHSNLLSSEVVEKLSD